MFRRVSLIVLAMLMLAAIPSRAESPHEVLSPKARERVDVAVDRGLRFLAANQLADGSFDAPDEGQPGITGLCILAFLSRGHLPGQGQYGKEMDRAVDYVLSTQRADGLFTRLKPEPQLIPDGASHTAVYNHCIAGLVLSEVCGMSGDAGNPRISAALDKALSWILNRQKLSGVNRPIEHGGWRYLHPKPESNGPPHEADMSVTSWVMLFLRSAKNAGRDVPAKAMDDGLAFIARCFRPDGQFEYMIDFKRTTIAMAGAGILTHSLAGRHDSPKARAAARFILQNPLTRYNVAPRGRFHYTTFYCTLGMFQIGGDEWAQYFPQMVETVLSGQHRDGSWDSESVFDESYGNIYTTSLCIMALNTPRQMIPIFQR